MSRLWDTPDFWARTEADEMLRDYPMTDVAILADSIERSPLREGDIGFTREVVAELRQRVAADVRFWPEHAGLGEIAREAHAAMGDIGKSGWDMEEAEESPVPWWQRW